MLKPSDRQHLLQSLRPPAGYDLSEAIGTTYSLDLMTLLSVPLSFALLDWEDEEGRPAADPLALLEAARRYADRVHIFCQAGGIHLPGKSSPLLFHLEHMVHEVLPPREGGIFHPKVWVLRFQSEVKSDPVLYRVLCLSRNLTFDRSWDTVLSIDGELIDRDRAFAENHPLGDFIATLPSMMVGDAADDLKARVQRIQKEVRRVRFEVPEGFEALRFHPMGLGKENFDWFFPEPVYRIFAMAPFVNSQVVKRMLSVSSGKCVLVSRLEELSKLNFTNTNDRLEVYSLDPRADGEETDSTDAVTTDEILSGLHAKLFITENGWDASMWTGSANATNAAFSKNVEFLCELQGKRSKCGIDALLSEVKGETQFKNLLRAYALDSTATKPDADGERAEERAESLRRALVSAGMHGVITPHGDGTLFDFALNRGSGKVPQPSQDLTLRLWPVQLPETAAQDGSPLLRGETVQFQGLSFAALTSFMAFEIVSTVGARRFTLRFISNVPMEGFPADRNERLLREILTNRAQVLRFLLLLLADAGANPGAVLECVQNEHTGATPASPSALGELALLEPLLEMLDRQPAKLRRIARLVDDLKKTPEGTELLPPGFLEVWDPIWHVAKGLIQHE